MSKQYRLERRRVPFARPTARAIELAAKLTANAATARKRLATAGVDGADLERAMHEWKRQAASPENVAHRRRAIPYVPRREFK